MVFARRKKKSVFANNLNVLDVIEYFMPSTYKKGDHYFRLDGGIAINNRPKSIAAFNTREQARVMLCTAQTSSLGISFCEANRVILIDVSWNPATGRATSIA